MEALGKAVYLVGLVLLLGLAGYTNGIVGVTAMAVFFICYRMIADYDEGTVYYPFETFLSDFESNAYHWLSSGAVLAIIVGTLFLLPFPFGEVANLSFWITHRDGVTTTGEFVGALFACAAILLTAIPVVLFPGVTAHIIACVILLAFGLSVGGLLGAAVSAVIIGGFYVARMVIQARERARMEYLMSLGPSFTARPDQPRASGARMAG